MHCVTDLLPAVAVHGLCRTNIVRGGGYCLVRRGEAVVQGQRTIVEEQSISISSSTTPGQSVTRCVRAVPLGMQPDLRDLQLSEAVYRPRTDGLRF